MRFFISFRLLIFCFCMLLLAACNIGRHVQLPQLELPEEFQLPDSVSKNLDSAIIPIATFFEDTTLIQLINDGFENNFDIRTIDKDIDINKSLLNRSKAAALPSLNLNLLTIERRWFSQNSRNSPSGGWYDHKEKSPPANLYLERSDYYSNIALNWEIDIWGKFRRAKESARAMYRQSRIVKRTLQTELVATIAEDYYTLLMLDEQLKVAVKNRKFRDSTLSMIKLLYNAGEVSALAVQQSETQVLEAVTLISEIEEEQEIRENNLRLLTGKLPQKIRREVTINIQDSDYYQIKKVPLYLVQNRPDVLAAQYELVAANARVGVAQVQRYPNLSISLDAGFESLLPQNWFNIPGSLFGAIIGGITQPVFQNRKLKTQYEIAKLERDQAEIFFQRKVFEAVVDIKNTQVSVNKLEEQLSVAITKQRITQMAVENARMLFRSGFANYLEVITAQSEALSSELELVSTKARLLVQRVQLYRALGGGWY